MINRALFRHRWRSNDNIAVMRVDKSSPLATIGPMSKPNPKLIPIKKINAAGFRWPEFSPVYREKWRSGIRMLLQGHSGGEIFKVVEDPDGFRSDVHFWREMRMWAAMAYAYADLGGDGVPDLAVDLLRASSGSSKKPQAAFAFRLAMEVPAVLKLTLAGVADMRERIGAEPAEWAKEHLKAAGMSPEAIEKYAAQCSYSDWLETTTG